MQDAKTEIPNPIQPAAEATPVSIPDEIKQHGVKPAENEIQHDIDTHKELQSVHPDATTSGPNSEINPNADTAIQYSEQKNENPISLTEPLKKRRKFSIFGLFSIIANMFKKTQEAANDAHAQHVKGLVHYGDAAKAQHELQASLQKHVGPEVEKALKEQTQNLPTASEIPQNVTPIRQGVVISQPGIENAQPSNVLQFPTPNRKDQAA